MVPGFRALTIYSLLHNVFRHQALCKLVDYAICIRVVRFPISFSTCSIRPCVDMTFTSCLHSTLKLGNLYLWGHFLWATFKSFYVYLLGTKLRLKLQGRSNQWGDAIKFLYWQVKINFMESRCTLKNISWLDETPCWRRSSSTNTCIYNVLITERTEECISLLCPLKQMAHQRQAWDSYSTEKLLCVASVPWYSGYYWLLVGMRTLNWSQRGLFIMLPHEWRGCGQRTKGSRNNWGEYRRNRCQASPHFSPSC